MDLNYLKRLLKIFDESSAHELEIEEESLKLRLAKQPSAAAAVLQTQPAVQYAAAQQVLQPTSVQSPVAEPASAAPASMPASENYHEVRSPIVGTFYRSPSPDQPPYVEVGAKVQTGQVLCIVEAMKLMNEIESDASGTIIKVLVNNAEAVEYNQPLFLIKPD